MQVQAPTIVVTAHYDTFSIAPAAPTGADSNGSGVAALLALMKMFHRLYSNPETRPNSNLLFLLTSGGVHGFEGVRQWLNNADTALLEAVELVLSLDSIGSHTAGQRLCLHHGVQHADATTWHKAFHSAGQQSNIVVRDVFEEVDAASSSAGFAHEHFARRGIAAVTLTCKDTMSTSTPLTNSLTDTLAATNSTTILQATQVAATAISQLLYPDLDPELQLIDMLSQPQSHMDFMQSWLRLLVSSARMYPFDQHLETGKKLHATLVKYMREHGSTFKRQAWQPSSIQLRAWDSTTAKLTMYRSAGVMLDMVLTTVVIIYLAALFAGLRIVTRGWADFVALFQAAPPSRKRSNRS